LPKVRAHGEEAAALLRRELGRRPEPRWQDPAPDPQWAKPSPTLVEEVEQAQGMVAEHFALCQALPLGRFALVAQALRPCGERPGQVRAFAVGREVRAAAVWTRDGIDWRLIAGVSAAEVQRRDKELQRRGFMPIDLACLVPAQGEMSEKLQYA